MGFDSRPSNPHRDDPTFHGDMVNISPRSEAARSSSKAIGKEDDKLYRFECMPEYRFRALTGVSTLPQHTGTSLERLSYQDTKHAVCVGEFSDGSHLYCAGIILAGQHSRESKDYVRIGYCNGRIPLQAKQARPVPSQKVDWLVL